VPADPDDNASDPVNDPSQRDSISDPLADREPMGEVVDGIAFADADADEIDRLQQTVRALEARLRTVSAAYKQQQDDIAATKDRLTRQASLQEELRRGEVVGTLFEPVENLRRSVEVVRKEVGQDAAQGLELVLQQFLESFQKLGLEEVPGKGSRFDPNLHEALTTMPVADPALDGVVMEVFDRGYRIGSRLLKPSRVVIGRHQEGLGEA